MAKTLGEIQDWVTAFSESVASANASVPPTQAWKSTVDTFAPFRTFRRWHKTNRQQCTVTASQWPATYRGTHNVAATYKCCGHRQMNSQEPLISPELFPAGRNDTVHTPLGRLAKIHDASLCFRPPLCRGPFHHSVAERRAGSVVRPTYDKGTGFQCTSRWPKFHISTRRTGSQFPSRQIGCQFMSKWIGFQFASRRTGFQYASRRTRFQYASRRTGLQYGSRQ